MSNDLLIECECGSTRGIARGLSRRTGSHRICYCGDCQAFAHFLGNPRAILDEHGGTEIFQTSPARLEISEGLDRLRCMRLTPKGTLRWYASCCRTPVANTANVWQMPFVGVFTRFLAEESTERREELLGPVGRDNARLVKAALGDVAANDGMFSPASFWRLVITVLRARSRGDHKRSPFFDNTTRRPIVTPTILAPGERSQLNDAVRSRSRWVSPEA